MDERIKIGALIRSLRKRTGLAQVPFALKAGVDRKQMYRIENARQSAGLDQLTAIFLALEMPLSSLLADAVSRWEEDQAAEGRGGEPPVDMP